MSIYNGKTFDKVIKDNISAIKWLTMSGFIPFVTACLKCQGRCRLKESVQKVHKTDGYGWWCDGCRKFLPVSIRVGTVLQGSKYPAEQWCKLLWAFFQKLSVSNAEKWIHWSTRQISRIYRLFQKALAIAHYDNLPDNKPWYTYEIDETNIRKRKRNDVGTIIAALWIFGYFCEETKQVHQEPTPDGRGEQQLLPIIQEHLPEGSNIKSDQWSAYIPLPDIGYHHRTVSHTYEMVNGDNGCHINNIERTWKETKKIINDMVV